MAQSLSGELFQEPEGATPLENEEIEALIPTWVANREDLNAAEADNILKARAWARRRKKKILTADFAKELHRKMFEDVWDWAGT